MKKLILAVALIAISLSLFADGDKNKSLGLMSYNPNPSSGDVVPALNLYLGPGSSNGFGFSFGGDFEIPMFVDNLTIGPGIGAGLGTNSYWRGHSTTFDFKVDAVAYYYVDWLIPSMPDEFDVFINSTTGVIFRSTSYHYDYMSTTKDNGVRLDFETYVGGRWNYSDNMSLYAKVGYGSYYGAVGISFKM
jgi:hypothetical protein